VTIEQLLSHRAGIGDYLNEDLPGEITDYPMTEPLHRLSTTAGYLPALDGHPMRDPPGAVFRYNNAGYVVLALPCRAHKRRPLSTTLLRSVCAYRPA
jgi:CubicO group peptidase (beta-lactamase class C family)